MKRQKLILIGILAIFVAEGILGAKDHSPAKVEALEKKLPQVSGREKVDLLNQLSDLFYEQSPKKCIDYSQQALELARAMNYTVGEGTALKHLGRGYVSLGENEKALECAQDAKLIFEKSGDKNKIADILSYIGTIYLNLSDHNRALDFFLRALRLSEEIGDKELIRKVLNNIGVVYIWLRKFTEAREYYLKSLQMEKESGDKEGIATSLNNLGMVYETLKKIDQAVDCYTQAVKIYEEINYKAGIAYIWMNLGILYANQEDYKKSAEYINKSIKLFDALGLKIEVIRANTNLGELYSRQNQFDKALKYLEKALLLSREIKDTENIKIACLNLSVLYEQKGDYKKALEFHRLFFEAYEKMFNEQSSRQIAEMKTRYDSLKKDKENEILKKDNQIKSIQLGRERFTRNSFIAGFIVVLIILVLLFKKYLYLLAFWKKQRYIGEFRLMEKIGSGGMGIIYKAHHVKNKADTCAVKVLREELSENPDIIKRFKQEATIIDQLDHDNIVKIIERGQYKQRLFIAMEFLQGKTLETRLTEDGRLSIPESIHIMAQISDALALIHSKNVIHRDLKPSNIMLVSHNGTGNFVKLLDFGVARLPSQTKLTRTGILLGTTPYLSPEQITGSEVSTASDVFSLGIIFYEMVCGRKPFVGESENDIIKEILETVPVEPQQLWHEIPAVLNGLIMRMLEKGSVSRPTGSEILVTLQGINAVYPTFRRMI